MEHLFEIFAFKKWLKKVYSDFYNFVGIILISNQEINEKNLQPA